MLGRLRAADPFIGTVGEPPVLPDRHGCLELVDQRVARVKCLRPVRARHADDHRQVAHVEVADAVDRRDPDGVRVLGRRLFRDPAHLLLGRRVRRVSPRYLPGS